MRWLSKAVAFFVCIGAVAGKIHRKVELDFDLDSALCENRLSAFFVSDNTDVSALPSREIANVTEEECKQICSENRDADGKLVICASFSYDHVIFKCAIYKRVSGPDGDLERIDAPGKRYFEKFCLDESAPTRCSNKHFTRVDDSILRGYAKNTSIEPTLAACVTKCLAEQQDCKSAMYFYEEGECITNIESALSKPEDIGTPDDDDKVVYFHNGCYDAEEPVQKSNKKGKAKSKKTKLQKYSTEKKLVEGATEETIATETPVEEELATTPAASQEAEAPAEEPKPKSKETSEEHVLKHPKGRSHKLYGAKQLMRQENGTITIDDSATTEAVETTTETTIEEVTEEVMVEKTTEAPEAAEKESEEEEKTSEKFPEEEPEKSKETSAVDDDTGSAEHETAATEAPEEESITAAFEQKSDESDEEKLEKVDEFKADVLKGSRPTKKLEIKKIPVKLTVPEPEEDIYFSKWGEWTECKQPGERKIRRRKCLNLKRCRGALMQVDWCPKTLPTASTEEEEQTEEGPLGPLQEPLPIAKSSSEGSAPGIIPPQLPKKKLKPLPAGAPGGPEDVWSPWSGVCMQFASTQPCKNHEVIGFESRECIAKDPKVCKGPFFRYCTLPC